MINDYEQAMELVREMESQLPIPARPTATMMRALRGQGSMVRRDQKLLIDHVFYAGDEGGITCGIKLSEDGKEVLVISVTLSWQNILSV